MADAPPEATRGVVGGTIEGVKRRVRGCLWTGVVGACVVGWGCTTRPPADEATSSGIGVTGGIEADSSGEGADSLVLDVQGGTAGSDDRGEGGDASCTKVDLLFVIDNSGSMQDEQANLIASFPGFIAAMRTTLADTEGYNVGVTTTDRYLFGGGGCSDLGALVVRTSGQGSSNQNCSPYASGKRYMTEADDLESKFACAAQVGINGDGNERPMEALGAALSSTLAQPGECNEGFLREDALLVVVLITDEEDDHETDGCDQLPQPGSAGEPAQWFDAVVAAKGGDETAVVVLALVGPEQGQLCPMLDKCNGGIIGAEVASRIVDFTGRFTHGFVGSVCEPYGPFFQQAIDVIESACDDFMPPA